MRASTNFVSADDYAKSAALVALRLRSIVSGGWPLVMAEEDCSFCLYDLVRHRLHGAKRILRAHAVGPGSVEFILQI